MQATLHVRNNFMSLTIPVELNVPRLAIEHHEHIISYNYRWKLAIRCHEGKTEIKTVHGSGRGQADRFDEFVGKEIAGLRLSLMRQLRRISAPDTMLDGEQTVTVYVSDDDVERMQRMIDEFKATPDGETASFRYAAEGPYHEEYVRELVENYERARVASMSPEERLLEAIFGRGHKRPPATD